jgi:hypothetical protein
MTRYRGIISTVALMIGISGCATVPAGAGGPAAAEVAVRAGGVDYREEASWLCRPGRDDACAANLDVTVIHADGRMEVEAWRPHPDPPIDCFYVYPTVSQEMARNASIRVTAAERNVAVSQFAHFGSQCRTFAPLYRQMTLLALRSGLGPGTDAAAALEFAYEDVRDAWLTYLARDNGGRGVVLISHSQGSIMLNRLIQEEIEGSDVQDRVISALLLGWNVMVPEGRDVGGDFEEMPLCRVPDQIGCVVSYVSFRATTPPPPGALFGRSEVPGMTVACVNPAALRGGRAELDARLPADRTGLPPWVTPERPVTTPFVRAPGLLTGECVSNEHGSYLSIGIVPQPGPRTDVIGGDVRNPDGSANAAWGLHLYDAAVGMGDLLRLVEQQSRTYLQRRS